MTRTKLLKPVDYFVIVPKKIAPTLTVSTIPNERIQLLNPTIDSTLAVPEKIHYIRLSINSLIWKPYIPSLSFK